LISRLSASRYIALVLSSVTVHLPPSFQQPSSTFSHLRPPTFIFTTPSPTSKNAAPYQLTLSMAPVLIAIAGGSASGKKSVQTALANSLQTHGTVTVKCLHQTDFVSDKAVELDPEELGTSYFPSNCDELSPHCGACRSL
jgi:hypothetical protein